MKHVFLFCLCVACCLAFVGCGHDDAAYESCKRTLSHSIRQLSQTGGVSELEELDRGVTDTLAKYGHARMSREMLDELKALLKEYQSRWAECYQKALKVDSLYKDRVKMMPGIGAVEFKAPPEV